MISNGLCVALKTGIMMLRIQLCITGRNYILQYIFELKTVILNNKKKYFTTVVCFLLYFG